MAQEDETMKRYGGDLKKAKRILFIFALLSTLLWVPMLWAFNTNSSGINFFSIPILWAYGLIFLPIALNIAVNFAWRLFEQANR